MTKKVCAFQDDTVHLSTRIKSCNAMRTNVCERKLGIRQPLVEPRASRTKVAIVVYLLAKCQMSFR